jgi:hydroxymethylbilane synthase
MKPLRIGTRSSPLALWQARFVAERLRPIAVPRRVELVTVETTGDVVRDRPLSEIGGDGLFTKEIQRAILADVVDVAVHSLKDLPTTRVEGLTLAAVPERGPSGDALVSKCHASFAGLPSGALVATSSLRRGAQILHRRPDLRLENIRGNVDTRLRKLTEQSDLAGIVLAHAGLVRLGLEAAITEILDPQWMLPAVGQGALGLECRADDGATLAALTALNDAASRQAVLAERAFLRALGGGCLVPIGAAGMAREGVVSLRGVVLDKEGRRRIGGKRSGPAEDAERVGKELADELLNQGARGLLQSTASVPPG